MKPETVRVEEGGKVHIEGYPDAVRLIGLEGPKARQLSHYALHRADLKFAESCLESMNSIEADTIREALWRSATIHFSKCFKGNSARSTALDAKVILKGDAQGLEVFQFFDHLRNKHFVHDENSLSESLPCAAINGGGKDYKVERVFAVYRHTRTLKQCHYSNLVLLVAKSLQWVETKIDSLCNGLAAELEAEPLQELLKRPEVSPITTPRLAEMGLRRKGLGRAE
jgi:hypothetical protein